MDTSSKLELRALPLAPRLVLSLFLISVGFGYISALVQLHFQHAKPGTLLPTPEDAQRIYHGASGKPESHIEHLLEAPADSQFNGTGQMRTAFTTNSEGWNRAKKGKNEEQLAMLLQEREGERLSVLDWLRTGAKKAAYEKDAHVLSPSLATLPITEEFIVKGEEGTPRAIAIKTLLLKRCVDCHTAEGRRTEATKFPLDTYECLRPYIEIKTTGGMSLSKLAQTTHIHLLSFSILYGLTGLIFAFTSYPGWLRTLVAPLPLAAQLADVSCWWLARYDARFVQVIMVTGGLVAGGLLLQIVLSLFNMYGSHGKKVVVVLLLLAGAGGFAAKTKLIDPYLEQERTAPATAE